jgi:hypothetical protein
MAATAERFVVTGEVRDIRSRGRAASSSVELWVLLEGTFDTFNAAGGLAARQTERLLSTGLTVPVGQTVVLGSAAGKDGRRALILTVRPEPLAERR